MKNFHKPFNSKHEGYAVLLEEVEELKKEIFWGEKEGMKDGKTHILRTREEAVQVAAMAIRIIQELT